jgi:hypothetical protein
MYYQTWNSAKCNDDTTGVLQMCASQWPATFCSPFNCGLNNEHNIQALLTSVRIVYCITLFILFSDLEVSIVFVAVGLPSGASGPVRGHQLVQCAGGESGVSSVRQLADRCGQLRCTLAHAVAAMI